MTGRATTTALFGFSAMFVGAATAWSLGLVLALAWSALDSGIPDRQIALSLAGAALGLIVLLICVVWLYLAVGWIRRLPRLKVPMLFVVGTPFLIGFLYFGHGILSVIIQ